MFDSLGRYRAMPRQIVGLAALVVALGLTPTTGVAQECVDCVIYAATELNLRQDPALEAPVLRVVAEGSSLLQGAGAETDGYVPVSYDGVPGWVIAYGLVASPDEIGVGAATTAPAESSMASADERVTLAPLLLRDGPSMEAGAILEMPEGAVVTLTWEGAENGYVTVAMDGVTGWAYAEYLGERSGAA